MTEETVNFRRFARSDLEDVIAIFRSNIPKYFTPGEEAGLREFLLDEPGEYYVVEVDGQVIGSGGIALNKDDTVSLCWGMVGRDHLGTGAGKRLTAYRIDRSRKHFGNKAMVISTSQHTSGFYEKFGFRLTRHEPDGFGVGIDICEMRLEY